MLLENVFPPDDRVEKEALSDPEIINYKEVGDLEAFNTDGLRSLIKTMNIPNMIEKTLRYPGHIELMKIFMWLISCPYNLSRPRHLTFC